MAPETAGKPEIKVKAEATACTDEPKVVTHQAAGSQGLLVLEAFAGSFPVARHFQQLLNSRSSSSSSTEPAPAVVGSEEKPPAVHVAPLPNYHLAAYAGIELEVKFEGPSPVELGLSSDSFLDMRGSVSDFSVQVAVLDFTRNRLQDSKSGISGVVVLGGPPCTMYSQANPRVEAAYKALTNKEQAYLNALLQHSARARRLGNTAAVGGGDAAAAEGSGEKAHAAVGEGKASAAAEKSKEAAAAADRASYATVQAAAEAIEGQIEEAANLKATAVSRQLKSDSLVKSFLMLVKAIQVECKEAGDMPCYLIMENPLSTPEKALWNRPFMHDHLLHLPNTPSTQGMTFRPKHHSAWLRPVRQNWCTYGLYPKKPTIIFTNLPKGLLPDRVCCKETCLGKIPGKNEHQETISNQTNAHDRAKWPVEFVQGVLQACVEAKGQVATLL